MRALTGQRSVRKEKVALWLPELIVSYLRPKVILSSPFRRCLQTVEPLAEGVNSVVCTPGEAISQLFDDP